MFRSLAGTVTTEIGLVFKTIDETKIEELTRAILAARRVVVCGAGRVGLACNGFSMRLAHLGITAFTPSDSNILPVGKGDLVILGSSSGVTQTVFDVGVLGKSSGAQLAVFTATPKSKMAELADLLVVLKTPTKFGPSDASPSIQPMATLFEQSLQILFDVIVIMVMKATSQSADDLWARHTNLD